MPFFKEGKLRSSAKVTLAFCLLISFFIIVYSQKQYAAFKRERCQLLCETAANMFKTDLNNYIVVNDILEAMLLETNGNLEKFDKIAANIVSRLPAIDCIQLAPKGVVTKSFPLSAYEGVGTSLFDAPDTKIGSSYALKTQKAYLTGPLTLDSGRKVILIQHPVFFPSDNGGQKFWGFTLIHLKLDNLFSTETLAFLDNSGYIYKLWKPDPQTSEIVNLAKNTSRELEKPCGATFKVTNSIWTLETVPAAGWANYRLIAIETIAALVISTIVSLVISFLVSIKDRDEALERLSYRDTLTSLFNARKFMHMLKELQKNAEPYSLIYLDLNDFKQVNDNLGHEAGDQVLVIAGRKLSNCVREADKAFRIGGDEFAVILPGAHEDEFVMNVIARIKESIARETVLKNARLQITSSAGFASCPKNATGFEDIIKLADNAMYEDKRKTKEARRAADAVDRKN